jgi:hypothetical protein
VDKDATATCKLDIPTGEREGLEGSSSQRWASKSGYREEVATSNVGPRAVKDDGYTWQAGVSKLHSILLN